MAAKKFSETFLKEIAKNNKKSYELSSKILKSLTKNFNKQETYDIFLSHSFKDADVIYGLKIFIESQLKLAVYVDWIDDPELDRSSVSKDTADRLRERMKNCKTLLVAHSESTPNSKWVPWEVGYFDSFNSKIAIIPITESESNSEIFKGQEYLRLYYYGVYGDTNGNSKKKMIWIQSSPEKYVALPKWIEGIEPSQKEA